MAGTSLVHQNTLVSVEFDKDIRMVKCALSIYLPMLLALREQAQKSLQRNQFLSPMPLAFPNQKP